MLKYQSFVSSSSYTFPTKWARYNMFLPCCDHRFGNLFLRSVPCLTSTFLGNGVGANDCKRSRDQRLNVLSEARKYHYSLIIFLPFTTKGSRTRCLHHVVNTIWQLIFIIGRLPAVNPPWD
jgi:hypothetical protein